MSPGEGGTGSAGRERRRTIVHVITTLEAGGAQTLLLDTVRQIDRENYRVLIVFLHGKAMEGIDPDLQIIDLSRDGLITPFAIIPLARLLRRERAALVHTHLVHADLIGGWSARLARIRPIVATRHYGIDNKEETRLYRLADRAARSADAVVAVSGAVRDHMVRRGIVPSGRIEVIHNGVDLERFDPSRHPVREPRDREVIGAVGRLHPQKGFMPLLEIFRAVVEKRPEVTLEIVGEGVLRPYLERQIVRLGLVGRVRLIGALPRSRMPETFADWDLFVMPSRWEGFGIAAAEAMAMEKPVVASSVEGLVELVEDHRTGILLQPGAFQGWVGEIVSLLGDPERRRAMGRAGRERVARQFSIRTAAERLVRLYDDLLAGDGPDRDGRGRSR